MQCGLQLHQMDVTATFLNGTFEEAVHVFMKTTQRLQGKEHLICLQKEHLWTQTVTSMLERSSRFLLEEDRDFADHKVIPVSTTETPMVKSFVWVCTSMT